MDCTIEKDEFRVRGGVFNYGFKTSRDLHHTHFAC